MGSTPISRLALAAIVTVQVLANTAARAQSASDHERSLLQAARNQLGLLEYCQSQGMVDESAVAAQRRAVTRLAPARDASVGDLEEAAGRSGYLAFDRQQAAFAASAQAQGISLQSACEGREANALAKSRH